MRRAKLPLVIAPFILLLIYGSLYLGRERLSGLAQTPTFLFKPPSNQTVEVVADGITLSSGDITKFLDGIFDVTHTNLPILSCPALNAARYELLRATARSPPGPKIRYFFALDLRQVVDLLPRLIGSIVEAIRFLGPESCALSIIEGDSTDGTGDVLAAARTRLEAMGVTYFFNSSEISSSDGDRIGKLATLRNMPLEPLFKKPKTMTKDTTVVFLNDVAACPDDILELVFQRQHLGADMTCAMDWTYVGAEPSFYDVWIARGMNGDSFFRIGDDGNWDKAWNLFWNAPDTRTRFQELRPFQVFACWNGAAAFTAQPILEGLRFRSNNQTADECFQGEPQLFCKDMWFRGFGKIAVIPTVNLEYSNGNGQKIKEAKGYTSDLVKKQDLPGDKFKWRSDAPHSVRCMPTWNNQFWRPWNETLA